ncbi:AAA family ATPase [Arthrobacter sp. MDB2-24]
MTMSAMRPGSRSSARRVVVLVGIDGAGKTTAARALSRLLGPTTPTLVLANHSGRRTMTSWLERTGVSVPPQVLDLAESVIRAVHVISNHLRSRTFEGVVILDRHLHCQQALRAARGLGRGRFVAAMTRLLPAVDAVVFLDVSPEEAYRRIVARGTDTETIEDLRAYRDGYLGLPEQASFHRIAADAPLLAVLDDLEEVLSRLPRVPTPARSAASSASSPAGMHGRGRATPARVEVKH